MEVCSGSFERIAHTIGVGALRWQDQGLSIEGTIEFTLFDAGEVSSIVPFFVGCFGFAAKHNPG